MPSFTRTININGSLPRNDLRKAVIDEFLKEQPGTGKGNKRSHYTYYVEILSNGNRIYLTRPAWNKMGFDFVIHVENMIFSNGKDNPSHDDIFNDLRKKKNSSKDGYKILHNAINDVYNCKDPNSVLSNIDNLSFNVGYDVDMILKVVKWFFIEQDIRYWNYSGRTMFKKGVDGI